MIEQISQKFKFYFLISIFSLFSFSSFSSESFTLVEVNYTAQDKESSAFIRSQLLYLAFCKIINKKFDEYNLKKEIFWKNYSDAFSNEWESIAARIESKYKGNLPEIPKEKLKDYREEIEQTKKARLAEFGNLKSYIRSYVIKKLSKSSRDPKNRHLVIEALIEKKSLFNLYNLYVNNQLISRFDKVYIDFSFNFKNASPLDLGVSKESDLTNVIIENWYKWFDQNKSGSIKEVILVGAHNRDEILSMAENDFESKINSEYNNSIFLKIIFDIKRISEIDALKQYKFIFSGAIYLKDLSSDIYLHQEVIDVNNKVFRNIDLNTWSSVLANYIYRLPMSQFTNINHKLNSFNRVNNESTLRFFHFKKISDVFDFIEDLKFRGLGINLVYKVDRFNKNNFSYKIYFQGQKEEFKNIINLIRGQKNVSFELVENNDGFTVKFI